MAKVPDFQKVSLHHSSNGCRCCQRTTCGMDVSVGEVLRLLHIVVQIQEGSQLEDAIKMFQIIKGSEACCVGFIPRLFAKTERILLMIGKCCIVLELCDNSSNPYKRRLSKRNYGVALCILIKDIPLME
jgi:hypothetical protein